MVARDGSMTLCINPKCQRPENSEQTAFCQTCGSELVLEGIYRAQSELGCGGFGKTFEVTSTDGQPPKVLKVLINPMEKAVELFKREAEVLEKLNHPGIPRVDADGYFVYFARNAEAPIHCLIMEKIDGLDLQEYIAQRGNRPVNQKLVLQWLIEVVKILEIVHSQNFFHRDIKPSNIMLRNDGRLALIDFGTAREVTGTYMAKQAVRGVTGIISTGYTPIEQLNGQAIQQSDFYALGRTMSYLLTAKEPSDIYNAVTDEFPWQQFAPNVHPDFADFLDQMMTRIPKYRPPNTQSILQSLNRLSQFIQTQDPVVNSSHSSPSTPPISQPISQPPSIPIPPISQPSSPPPISQPPSIPVPPISQPSSPPPISQPSSPQALFSSPALQSQPLAFEESPHHGSNQFGRFIERTVAAAIDLSLLGLTTVFLAIVIGIQLEDNYEGVSEAIGSVLAVFIMFVHPLMTWLYFSILHSSKSQATFGKQLMKLQVTGMNGSRLSFGKATARFMCKLLSVLCLIGYPLALFSKESQALHDMMAETRVIVRP